MGASDWHRRGIEPPTSPSTSRDTVARTPTAGEAFGSHCLDQKTSVTRSISLTSPGACDNVERDRSVVRFIDACYVSFAQVIIQIGAVQLDTTQSNECSAFAKAR
jgi:hypothetical protein